MNNKGPKFELVLFLLILFSGIGVGCKKDNDNQALPSPPGHADTTKQEKLSYLSLIQKHTDLIKTVIFDTTYQPYDGFSVTRINYLNSRGQHLAVFFLTVDLSKSDLSLAVGTGFNKDDYEHQTVSDMITYKNEADASRTVIGAVNGDYWQVHSGHPVPLYHPLGIVYKDGVMIKDWPPDPPEGSYYFFAVLKNKTALIGNESDYSRAEGDIEEGLGGRYLLLYHNQNLSGHLNKNVEPRTSVGLLNNKKVVFIVVDGRREGYSVGVSMQTLAALFQAVGAVDAVNLDGGGSTTLVLKSGKKYVLENKPSGNAERAVANAWMVMYKK